MVIVIIGWVFFSCEDLSAALDYLGVMFGAGSAGFADTYTLYLLRTNALLLIIGCIAATPEVTKQFGILCKKHSIISILLLLGLFILSVAYLIFSSYNPFLYFRF